MEDTISVHKNNYSKEQGREGWIGYGKNQEGREIEVLSVSALVVCWRMRDCPAASLGRITSRGTGTCGWKREHQLGELTDGGCPGQPELLRQMTSIAHGAFRDQWERMAAC